MEDLNKISSTRVGDNIHFYVNGQENKGTVVKMDTSYVTVLKDDGNFQDIHINETFFIKDILVNKTWNDMTMEERTVKLHEIKAYSPRFLAKSWQDLPRELKIVLEDTAKTEETTMDKEAKKLGFASATERYNQQQDNKKFGVGHKAGADSVRRQMKENAPAVTNNLAHNVLNNGKYRDDTKKSNVEQGHLGSAGRASHAVETNTDFDAPDDYEGQTEDEKKEQFKHEDKKPQTTNKTLQEQLWEDWLNKESMGGGDSSPAQTSITTGTTGMYNAVYGKDGRIKGQEKDKDEEETEKDKEEKEKERKG